MFLTVLGPGYKNASVQFRNIGRGLLEQPKDESGKEHNATTLVTLYPAVVNAAHARLQSVCSMCSLLIRSG